MSMLLRPEVAKQMAVPDPPEVKVSELPTSAESFTSSDEKPPTLVPSESCMALEEKAFSIGRFKVTRHFDDLTKVDCLYDMFVLQFFV